MWIRSILILTCTSVSFAHGSNDGQKGVGLIMLILIAFAPVYFAVDRSQKPANLLFQTRQIEWTLSKFDQSSMTEQEKCAKDTIRMTLNSMIQKLNGLKSFDELKMEDHFKIRKSIIVVSKKTEGLLKSINARNIKPLTKGQMSVFTANIKSFKGNTEYSPRWVILLVSISLGLGTMIGWKRIVVTIGEKIGKTHMTYAQGASSNIVAASTILASSWLGLPVSTTHVLSSGVAGAMVAGSGKQNLRMGTVKSIALAWLITLPITIVLSGGLFYILRIIFK